MNIGQRVSLLDTTGEPSHITGDVRGLGSVDDTHGYVVMLDRASQDYVNTHSNKSSYISLVVVSASNLQEI